MKNKISYIVSLLSLILIIESCNDKKFLDVLPRGQIIAKTTSDFRKLLDDVDNQRYAYSFSLTTAYLDALTDDVYADSSNWIAWTTTRAHVNRLYAFTDQVWIYTALADDNNWKYSYYISSLVASLLAELPKATDNIAMQKQLIAESRVHRAYAYLLLVNAYAKPYNTQTAKTDLGVPILLNPTALPALNRNTVQEVYDFILKELKESVNDLPDDLNQYKHRPTKTAVYAILARTYLYMGDYTNALSYAEKSLQIRKYLYDYNTIYTGTDYYGNIIGISRTNDEEMLLHKTTAKSMYLNNYMILDTASYNKLYPDFSMVTRVGKTVKDSVLNRDLRRSFWFDGINNIHKFTAKKVVYIFSRYQYRYKQDGSNTSAADNIPVATPEMYLTRAECNARLGNLQVALDDVNAICTKRYKTGTFVPITLADLGNNKENVIARVLLERRRELYGKELRLFDIKRLHLPVTHYISSLKISVPADDPRFVWPIYTTYIDQNPELEQNPRNVSGVTYTVNGVPVIVQ